MIGLYSDRILCPDGIFDGWVWVEDGKITGITREKQPCETFYDFTGKYVSPGFIDMHTHGAGGHPFINGTVDDVIEGCNFHLRHGTTTILPTVTAGPFPVMRQACADVAEAKRNKRLLARIPGAHMEGPYLSAAQCGAQCPDFITPPNPDDYRSLVEDYGADIARWTYAPENDADGSFASCLTEHGILPSAGHTNAVYADMVRAIDNGCRLITHLYSCTSTVTRDHGFRSLGVIESAYLRDDLDVEIIADGKHLPPELIRMIVKIKGIEHTALVTDSLAIAGTDVREGVMSGTAFIVEDGVCKLRDRSAFAGSVATADRLVRVMTTECGFSVPDAVRMITETPARILGLNCGKIEAGCDADFVVFDDGITVTDVFVAGRKVC